jgi:tetratricopeptide (TPR) repeat protein
VKILFLAANPIDQITQLRGDIELREIRKKINEGTHSAQLELVSELAVRAGDLTAALLTHQPDIVHFSGHGSQTGGIILEDENGFSKIVSREVLADLFRILKGNICVIVLNACYAKDQAQALIGAIDCVIGTDDVIEDKDAISFSAHFYQALAFGHSVEAAFELSVTRLKMESIAAAQIPEMLVRDGIKPSEIQLIKPSHSPVTPEKRKAGYEGPQRKHHLMTFLPRLFACLAISLTIDVLPKFVGEDNGWPDSVGKILESVFILFAITILFMTCVSLLSPANSLLGKAISLGGLNRLSGSWKRSFVTGIAMILAFGLWSSLPIFARYYNEKGIKLQYGEQPDEALARLAYQRAVRLKPDYAQAHYNLASVLENWWLEKAIEEYLLAIQHDSHIYPAYNNLARLYLLRGQNKDNESALSILNQAGDLSQLDENVQYSFNKNLGWAHYALKHYSLAETHLRKAISQRDKQSAAAAHCLLAYALKEQGRAEAIDECFDCVRFAPGENDVEYKWFSDAQECLMRGESK